MIMNASKCARVSRLMLRLCAFGLSGLLLLTPSTTYLSAQGAGTPSQGDIKLDPCALPDIPSGAKCGTYSVYEDRLAKAGRRIGLHVVVVPALDASPQPDPVFWLDGGPGAAASQAAGYVSLNWLRGLHKDHDLVFIDQRGTGQSAALRCADIGETPTDLDAYFGKLFPPDRIGACRDELEKTANLRLYTTDIAMDDLEDIRRALGYQQIDIAGLSYGTLAAQVYMRKYPAYVRAAVLVGATPLDFRGPLPFPQATQRAFDLLVRDCRADDTCSKTFPNLRQDFYSVLARFGDGSLPVTIMNPATQQERVVLLQRENYVEHLRAMLYSTWNARYVPFVVHQAALGDFIPFGTIALRTNLGGSQTARGLYFSVTCAESIPFITKNEIVQQSQDSYLGDRRIKATMIACKEWPKGKVPKDFIKPLRTTVPILVLSGEVDGAVQPSVAGKAMRYWPNSLQVMLLNTGHQFGGPCMLGMTESFIRRASTQSLNTSCAKEEKRPAFVTKLSRDQ